MWLPECINDSTTCVAFVRQVAASEPPESAFKSASRLAGSDGDLKGLGKEAAKKAVERSGSVWGVFGRVSSLLSTASSNKKKVYAFSALHQRILDISGLLN